MQRFPLLILAFVFVQSLCFAQQPLDIEIPEGPRPWSSLELNNSSDRFQFAIVTDRTGGHRPGVFMKGVRALNLLQPEFVMSVGDLIEGYTEDLEELDRQWDEFDGFIAQLDMPFFYVPGNHDITNKVMEGVWKERFGQTHYYFKYKGVLFMCLNSEDQYRGASRGSISDEQYEWIKEVLAREQDVKWTLLFMHQPLWLQNTDPVRWFDVEALLADRKHTVFVGHRHRYVKYERNNNNYFMLATTGGGSSLRGPELGEFDHVVWVTMTEDGPILANIMLEGVWDENVNTEENQATIEKLLAINAVRIEPFYLEEGMDKGEVTIRLTNDSDLPLTIRLDDGFSWDLVSSLSGDAIELAPNSVEFATLQLAVRPNAKDKLNFDPIEIHTQVSLDRGDGRSINIPSSYNVAPEEKFMLNRLQKEVSIDGKINEFDDLPYTFVADSKTEEDLSVAFNLGYNNDYLYFAAQVKDSDLYVDTSDIAWRQDYLALVIDNAPLSVSAMRQGSGWYRESMIYLRSPDTKNMPGSSAYDDRLPQGSDWACKAVEGGYIFEGRIPMSYLKEKQGDDLKTLRINVGVQDRDAGDTEFPRYFWMPDWMGSDNRIGSGMFFLK